MSSTTVDTRAAFKKVLFERLNRFFEENRLSKKGNWEMTLKVTFALTWWLSTYVLLFAANWTYTQFFIIYLLQGLGQIFMFLNISHDANHNAISNKRTINKILSYSLDACGISSYMWRIMHNKGHHAVMNVYGDDEGIFAHGIFRFSPHAEWKWAHQFQHIYVFFVYGITTLDFLFVKDFEYLFFNNNKHVENVKHPLQEWITIIGGKIIYLFYMIAVPVLVLNFSLSQVLIAFFVTHIIMGLVAAWIIQTAHLLDINEFPGTRDELDFMDHIFATTTDYATRSRVANFICGGLNHHVAHHIFPQVAHTHYPKLTKIIRETAAEFGVEYRENRYMYQAMAHHLKLLRLLGKPPVSTHSQNLAGDNNASS